MSRRSIIALSLLVAGIIVLFWVNLLVGSVDIPVRDMFAILTGNGGVKDSWRFIVMESRLPQAMTALLSGAALAVSGLLLQTAFHNPLAGPDVFGINSGAGLGVALVMLAFGGSIAVATVSISGFMAVILAALAGAMVVTAIIFVCSSIVKDHVLLLIIGIMIGYLASSVVSLLNFFATEEGVKSYMVWGMGNFGGVSMSQMPYFALTVILGLALSIVLVKPLNILLLGENYARNLGINIRFVRNLLLLDTGLLTAVVTAFCGPIAFIGLAVPNIARMLLVTDNHRILIPGTMLAGSAIALLCNALCCLPGEMSIIPLNAVTPMLGAPVIITTARNSSNQLIVKAALNGASLSCKKVKDSSKNDVWEITVYNSTGYELPASGGSGRTVYYITGACLIALSALLERKRH